MNTWRLLCVIGLILCRTAAASAAQPDDILGFWITENKDSWVEVVKQDDGYAGKIVALKHPTYDPGELPGMDGKARLDHNNPDPALQTRPVLGLEIVHGFRFDGKKWVDGKIYDPKNGKTYKCKITLAEDGKLNVRGFIGISLIGRTTIWERQNPPTTP